MKSTKFKIGMLNSINPVEKLILSITLTIMFCIGTRSQAQNWTPLGTGTNYYVRALCVFNQKLFVGGEFISAGGNPHNRVAIWDNNNWVKADSNVTWVGTRNFCIYNNELYAARDFGVSKWDGVKWVPVNGMSNQVNEMAVYQNELYAVGGGIQKWNGSNWTSIGTPSTDVNSVCVYNGQLVVGGAFTNINGSPFNHIAKWNGTTWSALGIGILGGLVSKVKSYNGQLFVCGSFSTSQGNASDNLTKWNGTTWSAAIPNINNSVTTMDSINGKLYLAQYSDIAVWNGTSLSTFGTGMNVSVDAITEYNGSFYIGGYFTMVGGNLNLYISKWDFLNGITNLQSGNNNLKISPNPFNDETILETDKIFDYSTLTVYDCLGNIVQIIKNITGKKINLHRENLTNGIYYIRLMENNNIIAAQKLIIVD